MIHPTKIIIKVDKVFEDEIDFNGGKLYMDTTYQPEWNVIQYGYVVAVPARNPYICEGFHYTAQVGDKIYIHYNALMDPDNLIEHEGEEYWLLDYFMALCVVRDGKIIAVGEHVIIRPVEEEVKHEFLIIPELAKKLITTNGIVVASNDPEIKEGSIVEYDESGQFENTIEGEKLFVMSSDSIFYTHGQ